MSKPLNKMNTLSDMTCFPWTVHLGASLNIVFSIWLTHQVFGFVNGNFVAFLPFAVILIGLNLLPVALMRLRDSESTVYRNVQEMDFFKDQHRFSTWVYGIASGNMLFWTVFAWWTFSIYHSQVSLVFAQLLAFIVTYVPLWRRFLR